MGSSLAASDFGGSSPCCTQVPLGHRHFLVSILSWGGEDWRITRKLLRYSLTSFVLSWAQGKPTVAKSLLVLSGPCLSLLRA